MKKQNSQSKDVNKKVRKTRSDKYTPEQRAKNIERYGIQYKQKLRPYKKIKYKYDKSKTYATPAHTRLKATGKYYAKKFRPHFENIAGSKVMNNAEREKILRVLGDMFEGVEVSLNFGWANDKFNQCIQQKFRAISKFLKDFESVDYNAAAYVQKFGFHADFIPEEVIVGGSIKNITAIENMEEFVKQCDRYI